MIQKIMITVFIVIIVELVAYFVHKSKKDSKAKKIIVYSTVVVVIHSNAHLNLKNNESG